MVANEATQGIDPDGSEKIMEEAHVIPLWQGINPADNDSKWWWFRQTNSRKNLILEICLLHAQRSDFWSAISFMRVAETVLCLRQCQALGSLGVPSCQQSGSRVLQPVGPLHWKCSGLRTFSLRIAYAPCFVDGLHDLDLEPTDWG